MAVSDAQEPISDLSGIEDPTEYKQRRRIQELLDASQRFFEQKRKAKDHYISGEIDKQLQREMVRDAFEEFLVESEQKILSFIPDESTDPEDYSKEQQVAAHVWHSAYIGTIQLPSRDLDIVGLHAYMSLPDVIRDEWEETSQHPTKGEQTEVRTTTTQIPTRVTFNAYRVLRYFWHELGLDIDMDQKMPRDKISYEYDE